MSEHPKIDTNWLCNWLEENSSGSYRPSKDAAHLIRELLSENQKLRARIEASERQPLALMQWRLIGESEWIDCTTVDWFNACQKSPEHDTRAVYAHPPIPAEQGYLTPHWVPIESPEDMPDGAAYVLWDGCELCIDFIDTEAEFGTTFFSNGTEATHYLAGLKTPQFEVKPS